MNTEWQPKATSAPIGHCEPDPGDYQVKYGDPKTKVWITQMQRCERDRRDYGAENKQTGARHCLQRISAQEGLFRERRNNKQGTGENQCFHNLKNEFALRQTESQTATEGCDHGGKRERQDTNQGTDDEVAKPTLVKPQDRKSTR